MEFNLAHAGASIITAFLASLVAFVEALTVVLAVGSVRGWRSAITGSLAALVVLLVLVAVLGSALTRIHGRDPTYGRHFVAVVRHALAAKGHSAGSRDPPLARRDRGLREGGRGHAAVGAGMAKGVSTLVGDLDPEGDEPAVGNIIDAARLHRSAGR